MDLDSIIHQVYEHAIASNWQWRFDKVLRRPSYEDVEEFVKRLIAEVQKSQQSISIESGGLLVKRTDDYIDIYVHVGGIK